MGKKLEWIQVEGVTAFIAMAGGKTYRVKWLPDAHMWFYDGRPFEHVSMAKSAAQTEYDLAVHKRMDDALARWLAEPETAKLLTAPHPALTQKERPK